MSFKSLLLILHCFLPFPSKRVPEEGKKKKKSTFWGPACMTNSQGWAEATPFLRGGCHSSRNMVAPRMSRDGNLTPLPKAKHRFLFLSDFATRLLRDDHSMVKIVLISFASPPLFGREDLSSPSDFSKLCIHLWRSQARSIHAHRKHVLFPLARRGRKRQQKAKAYLEVESSWGFAELLLWMFAWIMSPPESMNKPWFTQKLENSWEWSGRGCLHKFQSIFIVSTAILPACCGENWIGSPR